MARTPPWRVGVLNLPQGVAFVTTRLAPPLGDPLHLEFLAFPGTVEKIEIDQLLVRNTGRPRQTLEIIENLRAQVDAHGLFLAWAGRVHVALAFHEIAAE